MRFMMIVKGTSEELAKPPRSEDIAMMGRYNDQLVDAGVLLVAEGLLPTARGFTVHFGKNKQEIKDGPFTEAKEVIGGFWIIQVRSREEAIAWARKIPFTEGEVEVRQVAEVSDFDSDEKSGEALLKEQKFRNETQKPITR